LREFDDLKFGYILYQWETYQNLRGFCFVDLEKHDENLTFHLDPNLSCLQKTPDFSRDKIHKLFCVPIFPSLKVVAMHYVKTI